MSPRFFPACIPLNRSIPDNIYIVIYYRTLTKKGGAFRIAPPLADHHALIGTSLPSILPSSVCSAR